MSFTKPDYMANVLLATHDPQTDLYFATGLRNTKLYLLQINKTTGQIDSIGQIPGATSVGLAGSAIDVVNRKYIFVSNLGITVVSLDNPSNTISIPYPSGVSNVKGFQTNYFSAPLPRIQGSAIRAQFKNVETWLKNGMELPNTGTGEFIPTESGTYSYRVRRPDGSVSTSSEVSFSVTNSIRNLPVSEQRLFHNLVNGTLEIQNPDGEPTRVNIYNSEGRCLVSEVASGNGVDLRSLPAGVYQAVAQQKGQLVRKRFLKN